VPESGAAAADANHGEALPAGYHRPRKEAALQALLREHPGAWLVAGGTDAVLEITQQYAAPDPVIDITAVAGPDKIAMVINTPDDILTTLRRMMTGVDLMLAEGFKSARLPKLEVLRKAVHANPLFLEDPTLFALVTDIAMPSAVANGLEVFGLEDIPALADLIVERFLAPTRAVDTLDRCG